MTFTGNFVYLYLAKNRANLMLLAALRKEISLGNHFGPHLARCSISPLIYFPTQFQSRIRFSEVQHKKSYPIKGFLSSL